MICGTMRHSVSASATGRAEACNVQSACTNVQVWLSGIHTSGQEWCKVFFWCGVFSCTHLWTETVVGSGQDVCVTIRKKNEGNISSHA